MERKTYKTEVYKTDAGVEPVIEFLKDLNARGMNDVGKKAIEQMDLLREEGLRNLVGTQHVAPLREGTWELRANWSGIWARVAFYDAGGGVYVMLHGFLKKSNKTAPQDIAAAVRRMKHDRRRRST